MLVLTCNVHCIRREQYVRFLFVLSYDSRFHKTCSGYIYFEKHPGDKKFKSLPGMELPVTTDP